ncbi:MAG: type IV toxin-antitoxin system AbiEi family antitoxin domain-containing protein [Bacteroidales bacterium]|nr:type IV toxin-antitoxin system AbiEi family antitoxin domain-containing protein [Bacteroidales bacterium]
MTYNNDYTNDSSTDKVILSKVRSYNRGKLLFPDDFAGTGSIDAIRQTLHRLVKRDILVRLAHGIYLYPKRDNELGILYPSIEEIAKAIAKRDKARIVPTGVTAMNKLGLSTQVPLKSVYLTDGAPRSIQVGKRSIKFKKTTPKNLMAKGEISSLVIQALREIGKDNITEFQLARINELLKKDEPGKIIHDAGLAPAWIAKIMMDAIKNDRV